MNPTKDDCLRQMYLIAQGLQGLHSDLGILREEGQYLCHMDLRPPNILVFPDNRSTAGIWRITDFGLSKFVPSNPDKQNSMFSSPERQGPHLAPEWDSRHRERSSGRKSDIWSFGCIYAEVITFAIGGNVLLEQFRHYRASKSPNDWFFELEEDLHPRPSVEDLVVKRIGTYRRKKAIDEWLELLEQRDEVAGHYTAMLKRAIWANPEERWFATDVVTELTKVAKELDNPDNPMPAPNRQSTASRRTHQEQTRKFNSKHYDGSRFTLVYWTLSATGEFAVYLYKDKRGRFLIECLETASGKRFRFLTDAEVTWERVAVAGPHLIVRGKKDGKVRVRGAYISIKLCQH